MSTPQKPLHQAIPPLILGTGTFNHQFVTDPHSAADLPARAIVSCALDNGVAGFDTSPYYGPSEEILGDALAQPAVTSKHPRESYFIETKVGRIASDVFDYSPAWVRYSVCRSLERLRTPYLDLVYCHDVEFVSPAEVLAALGELRKLRDQGLIRYVGISGWPVDQLCSLAELVRSETGEPLDAVLSYGNHTVQNHTLKGDPVNRLVNAGVNVVLNASFLGMGLLTTRGVDAGPMAAWHPSPKELRKACLDLVPIAKDAGETLESVAVRWALGAWAVDGSRVGSSCCVSNPDRRVGVSVMGVVNEAQLLEIAGIFRDVTRGVDDDSDSAQKFNSTRDLVDKMRISLGDWTDWTWSSPDPGFVNARKPAEMGVVPDDGLTAKYTKAA